MHHLEQLAPKLVERLRSSTESEVRRAALTACRLSFERMPIDDPLVRDALLTLETGRSITEDMRIALRLLAERLDDQYLEYNPDGDSQSTQATEAARLFSQARTVFALLSLSGDKGIDSAIEAIYEAGMSTDDVTGFCELILASLTIH